MRCLQESREGWLKQSQGHLSYISFCRCHGYISANFSCHQCNSRTCGPVFCTSVRVCTAPAKHRALHQAGKWGHELLLLLLLGGHGAGLIHLLPCQICARPWIVPCLAYAPGLPHMNNPTLCRLAHELRWTAKSCVYFFWGMEKISNCTHSVFQRRTI